MITDERLRHIRNISADFDTIQIAEELISLRSQKARLIEDAERLKRVAEMGLSGTEMMCVSCGGCVDIHERSCELLETLDAHTSLMSELETPKE